MRRLLWRIRNRLLRRRIIDVPRRFPGFAPNSSGGYLERSRITERTINSLLPRLGEFARSVGHAPLPAEAIGDFPGSEAEREAARAVRKLLDAHGSDKAAAHEYHLLYGPLLTRLRGRRATIFEIGIGTAHFDVVSNMGASGVPGASLRAFRDFLPDARILGADIDRRVLFSEERIDTFRLDQTDPDGFAELDRLAPDGVDLFIDDGLHAMDANLVSLTQALPRLGAGGWVVVEDIREGMLPLWEVACALLPAGLRPRMLRTRDNYVLVIEKRN